VATITLGCRKGFSTDMKTTKNTVRRVGIQQSKRDGIQKKKKKVFERRQGRATANAGDAHQSGHKTNYSVTLHSKRKL